MVRAFVELRRDPSRPSGYAATLSTSDTQIFPSPIGRRWVSVLGNRVQHGLNILVKRDDVQANLG